MTIVNNNKTPGTYNFQLSKIISKGLYFLVLKIDERHIKTIKLINK